MARKYSSLDELLSVDQRQPLSYDEADDAIWMLLCERIGNLDDLRKYPREVGIYFASRYLEWEVGNGGFAQAAYNIPEWFEAAAQGYEALGKPKAVALIREAQQLLPEELSTLRDKGLLNETTIEEVFEHFRESEMAALDDKIPKDEWWIDNERVDYVRKHRGFFRSVR